MQVRERTEERGMVVETLGDSGPRIVFIHGGGVGGARAWEAQWPLAANWQLIMPSRPGYGRSPWLGSEDFERDADLIAPLIEPGDHIVGHSYGAAVAMYAAVRAKGKCGSLTLIESGTSDVAKDDPRVTAFHYAVLGLNASPPADDEEYLRTLFRIIEPNNPLPSPLPPPLRQFAAHLRNFRAPALAHLPMEEVAAVTDRKLHVSGGHSAAYEGITDRLCRDLGGERVVIPQGGHAPQRLGPVFNDALVRFLLNTGPQSS